MNKILTSQKCPSLQRYIFIKSKVQFTNKMITSTTSQQQQEETTEESNLKQTSDSLFMGWKNINLNDLRGWKLGSLAAVGNHVNLRSDLLQA